MSQLQAKIRDLIASVIDEECDVSNSKQAITLRLNSDDYSEFMLLVEETNMSKAALAKLMMKEALKDARDGYLSQMTGDRERNEKEYYSSIAEIKHSLFPDEPPYKTRNLQTQMFKHMPKTA